MKIRCNCNAEIHYRKVTRLVPYSGRGSIGSRFANLILDKKRKLVRWIANCSNCGQQYGAGETMTELLNHLIVPMPIKKIPNESEVE